MSKGGEIMTKPMNHPINNNMVANDWIRPKSKFRRWWWSQWTIPAFKIMMHMEASETGPMKTKRRRGGWWERFGDTALKYMKMPMKTSEIGRYNMIRYMCLWRWEEAAGDKRAVILSQDIKKKRPSKESYWWDENVLMSKVLWSSPPPGEIGV